MSTIQDMDHSGFQGCYAEHRVSVHSVSNENTTFIFKTPQPLKNMWFRPIMRLGSG